MIDWIFEGIANWVASIMTQVMDAVSGVFLEALGTDMTAMEEYFPFVTAAYSIMQYTAWALLFLIVVWQLFRTFGGPITEAEHPFELLARGALFAFLITYAKPIFSLVLEIARAPYTALMESSLDPGDFTFAGIEQALTSGLTTIVSVATVVGLILLRITGAEGHQQGRSGSKALSRRRPDVPRNLYDCNRHCDQHSNDRGRYPGGGVSGSTYNRL